MEKRKAGAKKKPLREKTRQVSCRIDPRIDVMIELVSARCGAQLSTIHSEVVLPESAVMKMLIGRGFESFASDNGIDPLKVDSILDERFGPRP